MFGTYDNWKLATPPEYEYMGTPPWEEEQEEEPVYPEDLETPTPQNF